MRKALFLAYLWLQFLGITLPWARMRLEDLLLPVLLITVWKELQKEGLRKNAPLFAFLGYSLFATVVHIIQAGSPASALFEWGVFAYGGLLFLAFRHSRLSDDCLWKNGALMSALLFLCFLAYLGSSLFVPNHPPIFGMVSGKMGETAMPFLARRFTFLHGNPNMLGHAMALPLLMLALPFFRKEFPSKRRLLASIGLMAAILIPLVFTLSKHLVLSLGILCAFLIVLIHRCLTSNGARQCVTACGLSALIAAGLLLETTVLFTTFPLKRDFPFINTVPGMYTIHQKAYWKINTSRLNLLGFPPSKATPLYQIFVDRDAARQTLQHYNSEQDLDTFCSFMDPHCEYLNLPFLFGFPALALAIAFLLFLPRHSTIRLPAIFFVTALLFSMMWDDILSKRAIWLCLALLVPGETVTPSDAKGDSDATLSPHHE